MRSRDPISDMPNLGPKSAAVLRRAGITDVGQLRVSGSVATYALVKAIEPRVSLNLLWALEGALTGLHWQQVLTSPNRQDRHNRGDAPSNSAASSAARSTSLV